MKNNFGEDIPDTLYKYMPWREIIDKKTGEKRNYTKELLINNEFYLSPANTLNDPFDSAIEMRVDTPANRQNYRKDIIEALGSKKGKNFSDYHRVDEIIKKMSDKEIKIKLEKAHLDAVKGYRKEVGITCFSTNGIDNKNNILMWSHYANYHKGICAVFNTDGDLRRVLARVQYVKKYPVFNYYEEKKLSRDKRTEHFRQLYRSKYEIWEYENEYRIIQDIKKGDYFFAFNTESLREIIYGCDMVNDQDDVIETLKRRSSPVKLYQAVKKKQEFGLEKKYVGTYGG